MKSWLTIADLSEYLQIPESKIRSFIKNKQIPFHDNHGFLRFHRTEIDEWMKGVASVSVTQRSAGEEKGVETIEEERSLMLQEISYRGRPMGEYTLTATIIFIGGKAWTRLPDFIAKTIRAIRETKLREHGRNYLYREEFKPFIENYYDYLRICCQLGLIDSTLGGGRRKFYRPTEYAEKMNEEPNRAKDIILEGILNIVRKDKERVPGERHSILLLWYFLTLKEKGIEPDESHFKMEKDKTNNYFPLIRLSLTRSMCEYLFENERTKEQNFLKEWKGLV